MTMRSQIIYGRMIMNRRNRKGHISQCISITPRTREKLLRLAAISERSMSGVIGDLIRREFARVLPKEDDETL